MITIDKMQISRYYKRDILRTGIGRYSAHTDMASSAKIDLDLWSRMEKKNAESGIYRISNKIDVINRRLDYQGFRKEHEDEK